MPFEPAKLLPALLLTAIIIGLTIGCGPDPSGADSSWGATADTPLRVAAAANLKFALNTLLDEQLHRHGNFQVDVTYGSSGNLRTQIEHGAPFDLFLSADMAFPQMLAESGQADPETLFAYAVGRLVIWVPDPSPIDVVELGERSLLDPMVRRIAVANPQHAPYGQAAVAAMESFGMLGQVEARFVLGENIAQAAQFVESGAADAGIIALALAVAPAMRDKGHFWEIPLDRFPPLLQGGVITAQTRQRGQAEWLRDLLMSPQGQEVLRRHGFSTPEGDGELSHATD